LGVVSYVAALSIACRRLFDGNRSGRRGIPAAAGAVAACLVAYLVIFSTFTIYVPDGGRSIVTGFRCSQEAMRVFSDACPFLGLEALAGVAHDEFVLWTRSSITTVRVLLSSLWLIGFSALAVLVAYGVSALPGSGRRRHPHREQPEGSVAPLS
jgi:hypothetical protein